MRYITASGDKFVLHRPCTYPLFYDNLKKLNDAVAINNNQIELFKLEDILYVS